MERERGKEEERKKGKGKREGKRTEGGKRRRGKGDKKQKTKRKEEKGKRTPHTDYTVKGYYIKVDILLTNRHISTVQPVMCPSIFIL